MKSDRLKAKIEKFEIKITDLKAEIDLIQQNMNTFSSDGKFSELEKSASLLTTKKATLESIQNSLEALKADLDKQLVKEKKERLAKQYDIVRDRCKENAEKIRPLLKAISKNINELLEIKPVEGFPFKSAMSGRGMFRDHARTIGLMAQPGDFFGFNPDIDAGIDATLRLLNRELDGLLEHDGDNPMFWNEYK